MPIFDYKCTRCEYEEEKIILEMDAQKHSIMCPKCGTKTLEKVFTGSRVSFDFKYNPLTDRCDWDGNTTQYYNSYNEAKARGEKVRLPEKGETGYHSPATSHGHERITNKQ